MTQISPFFITSYLVFNRKAEHFEVEFMESLLVLSSITTQQPRADPAHLLLIKETLNRDTFCTDRIRGSRTQYDGVSQGEIVVW